MKKTVLAILFVGLAMASCKKSYTCECAVVETDNSGSTPVVRTFKSTSSAYGEKMNEKQAKSACAHEQAALKGTYENFDTDNGAQPSDPDYTYVTTCTLK